MKTENLCKKMCLSIEVFSPECLSIFPAHSCPHPQEDVKIRRVEVDSYHTLYVNKAEENRAFSVKIFLWLKSWELPGLGAKFSKPL